MTSPRSLARCLVALLLLFVFLAGARSVRAQTAEGAAPHRPRIALVLEGGSALGLAHIGVIEWLEEHHIPVDYVAGTSMGGLVGGAYATGMTPPEMRAMLSGIDWNAAFSSEPPYASLPFRRKEDRQNIPGGLHLGIRHGLQFASALTSAQPVGSALSRIGLPYTPLTSFDGLPIPFRCMATDLLRGQPVVLHDGALVTALRATMSLPGIFPPVERDGRLLVDGGLLNNLPTEAAKAMGADIIIAVTLRAPPQRGALQSLPGVLNQSIDIATTDNERRSLMLANVVITPDVTSLGLFDFVRLDEFAKRGYAGAERQAAALLPYALNDADWNAHLAARQARRRSPDLMPRFVRVEGLSAKGDRALGVRLQRFRGKPLVPKSLEDELIQISGEGRYESLLYERVREGDREGLQILTRPKEYGPPFLETGLDINAPDRDNVQASLLSRLIAPGVGSENAEIRMDLDVGSLTKVGGEYYYPFARTRLFVAPNMFYGDQNRNVFVDGVRAAIYRERLSGVGADLGYTPNSSNEVRIGYQAARVINSVSTGDHALPTPDGDIHTLEGRWTFDTQDAPVVPTHGTRGTVRWNHYLRAPGAVGSPDTLSIETNRFFPIHDQGYLIGAGGVGTAFGSKLPLELQFPLGGPLRLGAYSLDEFQGSNYLLLTGGYLRHIAQLPTFVGGKVLFGGWYEYGGTFDSFSHIGGVQDVNVGGVAETLLGPVAIAFSVGERRRTNFFFSLGHLF